MNEECCDDEAILYVYILRCLLGLLDASLYAYRAFIFFKKKKARECHWHSESASKHKVTNIRSLATRQV